MENEVFQYCVKNYDLVYNDEQCRLREDAISKTGSNNISLNAELSIESASQLRAIKETFVNGRKLYPQNIPLLWKCIYRAHLYRKSGISDPDLIEKIIRAEQSWKSSSGHAFEAMVKELGTLSLNGTQIRYILQKDLNTLLKAKEIHNQPTDLAWLEKQVKGSVFDIYVITTVKGIDCYTHQSVDQTYCFGCVQCKTSIRDRVSRDIVPSKEAMDSKFWSIGFVLDGTMFSVPKYKNMVNGNENTEFKQNGWHGMYVLSSNEINDRIYSVDMDFDVVRKHTIKACEKWLTDRMGLTIEWRADI